MANFWAFVVWYKTAQLVSSHLFAQSRIWSLKIQCPLDIETLDIAAALAIAAATCVTDLRQYINNNLAYSNLKFLILCTN